MSLFLEIVTPDSVAFAKEVKSVVLPTANGRIHVLPHHIPIIYRVVPGYVKVSLQGEDDYFSINRGFVEVYGEKVSIITDGASKAKEEDEAAIEEAISRAQAALTEAKNSNIDQARVDQLEAAARYEMAKKIARNKSH